MSKRKGSKGKVQKERFKKEGLCYWAFSLGKASVLAIATVRQLADEA